MRKLFLFVFICVCDRCMAQSDAVIHEYNKTFTTCPFSDPNPVPSFTKMYPYFRYDGFTDKPVQKEWKVVELENDFIKLMILPEIGGKIWSAIEKSTGRSLFYYNHAVKFRDCWNARSMDKRRIGSQLWNYGAYTQLCYTCGSHYP